MVAPQQDPLLKGCEQAIDQLKFQTARGDALQSEVDELKSQIVVHQQLEAALTEARDLYRSAGQDRAGAGQLSDQRDQLRIEQIGIITADRDRLLAENEKLRHPGLLKSIFSPNSITGFALGYGAARIAPR